MPGFSRLPAVSPAGGGGTQSRASTSASRVRRAMVEREWASLDVLLEREMPAPKHAPWPVRGLPAWDTVPELPAEDEQQTGRNKRHLP